MTLRMTHYTTLGAKLSTKAKRQPLAEITNTKSTEKSTTEKVQELLQLPQAIQQKGKSGTRGTTNIPKHLSGQEMIQLLEEKKREKQKEEEDKLKRLEERAAKKIRLEEEKKRKLEQRQEKKEERERKAKEAKKGKTQAKRRKTCTCPACKKLYNTKEGITWVECKSCEQWYHLKCTSIPPRLYSKLEELDFSCELCL